MITSDKASFSPISQELKHLKKHQSRLSIQQYKTIRGQIIVGDIKGAQKGLCKIINK